MYSSNANMKYILAPLIHVFKHCNYEIHICPFDQCIQVMQHYRDLWMQLVLYKECVHPIIDLNPAESWLLSYLPVFHHFSQFCYIIPPTSLGIDV